MTCKLWQLIFLPNKISWCVDEMDGIRLDISGHILWTPMKRKRASGLNFGPNVQATHSLYNTFVLRIIHSAWACYVLLLTWRSDNPHASRNKCGCAWNLNVTQFLNPLRADDVATKTTKQSNSTFILRDKCCIFPKTALITLSLVLGHLLLTLTLISAWISNRMSIKGWVKITYPFPNFRCATVEA